MGKLGNLIPLILGIVMILLVVANIIITAVILSQQMDPTINVDAQLGEGSAQANIDGAIDSDELFGDTEILQTKIYLVQVIKSLWGYAYLDEKGYHKGFFNDLIYAVCEAAGVTCKIIIDDLVNCWKDIKGLHPFLGKGLQDQYYDACTGFLPTIERIHAGKFSLPFTTGRPSAFYHRPDVLFDHKDMRGKKIGFINGFPNNEKCIARNYPTSEGVPLAADQMIYVNNMLELASLLHNGTVDAAFTFANPDMETFVFSPTSRADCHLAGGAMMSRMDSEFPDIWNRGFTQIMSNGKFKQLCDDAKIHHGHKGDIYCIESYFYDRS